MIYSLATAACAFAPNLTWLLVFRFIVGLGLGGQLPVAVTLVSEYIPAHVRGRFIVLLESFWGLGWLCAALVSYFVIPKFDWHTAFLIGGLSLYCRFRFGRAASRSSHFGQSVLPLLIFSSARASSI